VDLSSFLEWQLWAFGTYESHFADLFQHLVRPGERCIDVGANIGIHTVRLAKLVGPAGEVIAFEADGDLARRARDNVTLNGLTNVRIIQAAASDRAGGNVLLYRPEESDANKGRASLLPHSYLTGSTVSVRTSSIDEVNERALALIKIDVEGYEAAVVSGAASTISMYRPSIVFEHSPNLMRGQSHSPFEWLQDNSYILFRIDRRRHLISGRAILSLQHLKCLPERGTNILAIAPGTVSRVRKFVSSRPATERSARIQDPGKGSL
jgi:FkbM family methyltransferase